MAKGEEVPWKCHTSAHPHASTLTDNQQTSEVKGLSKVPVRHGSYHPLRLPQPPSASQARLALRPL